MTERQQERTCRQLVWNRHPAPGPCGARIVCRACDRTEQECAEVNEYNTGSDYHDFEPECESGHEQGESA